MSDVGLHMADGGWQMAEVGLQMADRGWWMEDKSAKKEFLSSIKSLKIIKNG